MDMDLNPKPGHELRIFGFTLTTLVMIGLILGAVVGLGLKQFNEVEQVKTIFIDGIFRVGGEIFFNALKLLVVPVVFVSITCGVGALQDVKTMGRIGAKTLILYAFMTSFAIAMALTVSNLTNPGKGFDLSAPATFTPQTPPNLADIFIAFVPSNPIKAMAEADMIQVIVMAILFGVALAISGAHGRRVIAFFNDLNEVTMKLVEIVMCAAPIGVFCLIASVFSKQGLDAIKPLSFYFITVMICLFLHLFLVYGGMIKILGRLNPITFFKKYREVMVFAFSTSSSNATLPVTLEVTEKQLGVHKTVTSFTLPLGATVNMDGTAIMQGVATVFIAQAYGLDIGIQAYLMVILTATLASVGTAGVPGVGLVTLAMVLKQANLPVEGIGLIIGVDRLLDMTRTVVNVAGDSVVACIVAKSENMIDEKVYNTLDT